LTALLSSRDVWSSCSRVVWCSSQRDAWKCDR